MKYSYRLSKVGGWRGSSLFITAIRPWVISSISSRANKLEILEEWTDSVLCFQSSHSQFTARVWSSSPPLSPFMSSFSPIFFLHLHS